jgi:Ca2+-binding RTX toxin-like protein
MSHILSKLTAVLLLCSTASLFTATEPASASGQGKTRTTYLKYQLSKTRCLVYIWGTDGDDVLDGSGDNCDEDIVGYQGDDVLIGGSGMNELIGGPGQDTMTGGANNYATVFLFNKANESSPSRPDLITDFIDSGRYGDYIFMGGVCFHANVTCQVIGAANFSGVAGQVRYQVYYQPNGQVITQLQADLAGERSPDFAVNLAGAHVLTEHNVLFTYPPGHDQRNH